MEGGDGEGDIMSDITITNDSMTQATIGLIERRRTTAQAIAAAIDKWKAVVALRRGGVVVIDGGPHSCGLCAKFYKKGCRGCPVREKTGKVECDGSPYEEWRKQPVTERKLSTAIMELQFLESLRPNR